MKFTSVATFAFLTTSALVGAAPVDDNLAGGLALSRRELDAMDSDFVEMVVRELMNGASEEELHKRFEISEGQKEFMKKLFDLFKKFLSGFMKKPGSSSNVGGSATATPTAPGTKTTASATAVDTNVPADTGIDLGGAGGGAPTGGAAPTGGSSGSGALGALLNGS